MKNEHSRFVSVSF